MKLLVDAIYINNSGGLVLLQYLISELLVRNVNVHFLLDERVRSLNIIHDDITTYLKGSESLRDAYYKEYGNNYDNVLCFGNIPPTRKLKGKVFTFFQNVLLAVTDNSTPCIQRIKLLFKRMYIRLMKNNTDYWIVQTTNTFTIIEKAFYIQKDKICVLPFFNESLYVNKSIEINNRTDYAYIAKCIPQKNHKMLIDAWIELAKKGIYPKLHLTLDVIPKSLEKLLVRANDYGCKIVNHGLCDSHRIAKIYQQSKVALYVSTNESFGLGMIEAMSMGCDIIGPNLDYVTSICSPSEMFSYDASSLVNAICKYENGNSKKTFVKIKNNIQEFINFITK